MIKTVKRTDISRIIRLLAAVRTKLFLVVQICLFIVGTLRETKKDNDGMFFAVSWNVIRRGLTRLSG
jgi:hypothetical protein